MANTRTKIVGCFVASLIILAEANAGQENQEAFNVPKPIIRIEKDDPRVRDFPQFAAGDMYLCGNLIFSDFPTERLTHFGASKFCRDLDPPLPWPKLANLPISEEWFHFSESMGVGTPNGYDRNLILGWSTREFWTGDVGDMGVIPYFDGYSGVIATARPTEQLSVVCIRKVVCGISRKCGS